MPTGRNPIHRWPAWIEPALADDYTVKTEDRRVNADFELNSHFLVQFNTDESTIECSLLLDSLQSNWFEAFERDLLKQGSRWFLIDLWIGGQMKEHRARFKERPEANTRDGEEWIQYKFTLEIVRREGLTDLSSDTGTDIPTWPETMPVPVIDSYVVKPQDRRQKSELDIGTLFRIAFDTDESTTTCILLLNHEEANWFEAFERDILKQGSRWFKMPLWIGGQMFEQKVRFATRPEAKKESPTHTAYSFELDIAYREGLMEPEWVEYLLDMDPYEFMRLEDRVQIIVNIRYPNSLPFSASL